MKTFEQWLKENRNCEMPKGNVDAGWFIEHGLPMIVECSCCQTTMALPNAFIDDEGNIYCRDCGDYWSDPVGDNRRDNYSEF